RRSSGRPDWPGQRISWAGGGEPLPASEPRFRPRTRLRFFAATCVHLPDIGWLKEVMTSANVGGARKSDVAPATAHLAGLLLLSGRKRPTEPCGVWSLRSVNSE